MKRAFHLALAAVLFPVVSLPAVWGLWYLRGMTAEGAEEQRWKRRLLGVAVVDTLVAIALVLVASMATDLSRLAQPAPPIAQSHIGVRLDPDWSGPGVRIKEVIPGSAAEEAGVLANDLIHKVGDVSVESVSDVQDAVKAREPGVATKLKVERGQGFIEIEVIPVAALKADQGGSPSTVLLALFLGVGFLCVVAVLWVLGARRKVPGLRFWPAFVGILVASAAGGHLVLWFAPHLEPSLSLSSQTVRLLAVEIVLVTLALPFYFWHRRRGLVAYTDGQETWSVEKTVAAGLFYGLAWLPRILILAAAVLLLAFPTGAQPASVIEDATSGLTRGPAEVFLVLVAMVLLAPIAEEILFRGVLLPHLSRYVDPWAAIYLGAIVFGLLHQAHGMFFVVPMTLGVLLGWARLRSGGLVAPILLHVLTNSVAAWALLTR